LIKKSQELKELYARNFISINHTFYLTCLGLVTCHWKLIVAAYFTFLLDPGAYLATSSQRGSGGYTALQ